MIAVRPAGLVAPGATSSPLQGGYYMRPPFFCGIRRAYGSAAADSSSARKVEQRPLVGQDMLLAGVIDIDNENYGGGQERQQHKRQKGAAAVLAQDAPPDGRTRE